ncbi:MAG: GAF domain-containing protein, partial [Mycobacteriales bacterium]
MASTDVSVRRPHRHGAGTLVFAVRGSLLGLCLALAVFSSEGAAALPFLAMLAAVGTVDSLVPLPVMASRTARLTEIVVCALGIALSGGDASPLLAYLLAPAFAGGLADGVEGAVIPSGVAALVLLGGRLITEQQQVSIRAYTTAAAEWIVIAVLVGLLAAWVRRLRRQAAEGPDERYVQAYRLLTQLRTVTRRLPSSLDPVGVASALLRQCRDRTPYGEGVVLVHTAGARLSPLALVGAERLGFEPTISGDGPLATAWRTRATVVAHEAAERAEDVETPGPSDVPAERRAMLVAPLLVADRPLGVVVLLSAPGVEFDARAIDEVSALVQQAALPLETTLLFDDIRAIATAEERHRVAREIHDGIAQELVHIGYQLDEVSADGNR